MENGRNLLVYGLDATTAYNCGNDTNGGYFPGHDFTNLYVSIIKLAFEALTEERFKNNGKYLLRKNISDLNF